MLLAEKLELNLGMESIDTPEILTIRQIEAIKKRAIELWGEDKWLAELVKSYSKIVEAPTYKGQYSVVKRIFENQNCNAKTLNSLLLAVNCRFQMVCYSEPVVLDI
jgi:hypothetical protein